jgi:hypothetical protein
MFVVTPPARKQRSIAGGENRDSLQPTQETIDAAMVWTGTVPCPRFAFSNTLRLSQGDLRAAGPLHELLDRA